MIEVRPGFHLRRCGGLSPGSLVASHRVKEGFAGASPLDQTGGNGTALSGARRCRRMVTVSALNLAQIREHDKALAEEQEIARRKHTRDALHGISGKSVVMVSNGKRTISAAGRRKSLWRRKRAGPRARRESSPVSTKPKRTMSLSAQKDRSRATRTLGEPKHNRRKLPTVGYSTPTPEQRRKKCSPTC